MVHRPVVSTLLVFAAVFAAQTVSSIVGLGTFAFALALPLGSQPWTLVTSVYAHANVAHLLANTVAFLIVAPVVAYVTTSRRFHAFFLVTGMLSGVAQVVLTVPFGGSAVLGASGAIFALFGYVLVGNRASDIARSWLPLGWRGQLVLFAVVAAIVTYVTAAPGVALISHFAGFLLGAIAGSARVLHTPRRTTQARFT